jgi:hypothetical protein
MINYLRYNIVLKGNDYPARKRINDAWLWIKQRNALQLPLDACRVS